MLALAIGSGGVAEFIRYPANVEGMTLLGYPLYFMTILGFWKMAGAVAIVLPGFPRLKEWVVVVSWALRPPSRVLGAVPVPAHPQPVDVSALPPPTPEQQQHPN